MFEGNKRLETLQAERDELLEACALARTQLAALAAAGRSSDDIALKACEAAIAKATRGDE